MLDLDTLDFAKGGGFVTVVAQDARTLRVLMVARADRAALERTLATREMHYHSRTRGLWHKGATSGNVQRVVSLRADCDGDAVLAHVAPAGPACHTGTVSCFGNAAPPGDDTAATVLSRLTATIAARKAALPIAEGVKPTYTQRLLSDRNLRLKKLGEEAVELAIACADEDRMRAVEEGGDVIYHTLVALAAIGVSLDDVSRVLDERAR
ncbi:MAG: bifunctional phosphoribosyl-AMP cyclohydrolase/phosphoribosyl-ATP diphosphatase HisIE [Gemmatimonadota bacterium]